MTDRYPYRNDVDYIAAVQSELGRRLTRVEIDIVLDATCDLDRDGNPFDPFDPARDAATLDTSDAATLGTSPESRTVESRTAHPKPRYDRRMVDRGRRNRDPRAVDGDALYRHRASDGS